MYQFYNGYLNRIVIGHTTPGKVTIDGGAGIAAMQCINCTWYQKGVFVSAHIDAYHDGVSRLQSNTTLKATVGEKKEELGSGCGLLTCLLQSNPP